MHFQMDVAAVKPLSTADSIESFHDPMADLLRQMLEVQREQLSLLRHRAAANDNGSRWKAFLARWQDEFPDVASSCKQVLPQLERTYLRLIADLTDQLREAGADSLDNEFALAEFLDRYGMRLGQLGSILSLVGPVAEACPAEEAK